MTPSTHVRDPDPAGTRELILAAYRAHERKHGRAPHMRDLVGVGGARSVSSVGQHVRALGVVGLIARKQWRRSSRGGVLPYGGEQKPCQQLAYERDIE